MGFLRSLDPKVWKPTALAVVAIVAQVILTGEFDRAEMAQAILTLGYAVTGFAVPNLGTILRTPQETGNVSELVIPGENVSE